MPVFSSRSTLQAMFQACSHVVLTPGRTSHTPRRRLLANDASTRTPLWRTVPVRPASLTCSLSTVPAATLGVCRRQLFQAPGCHPKGPLPAQSLSSLPDCRDGLALPTRSAANSAPPAIGEGRIITRCPLSGPRPAAYDSLSASRSPSGGYPMGSTLLADAIVLACLKLNVRFPLLRD